MQTGHPDPGVPTAERRDLLHAPDRMQSAHERRGELHERGLLGRPYHAALQPRPFGAELESARSIADELKVRLAAFLSNDQNT